MTWQKLRISTLVLMITEIPFLCELFGQRTFRLLNGMWRNTFPGELSGMAQSSDATLMRCMAQSPRHLLGPHALSISSDLKLLRSSDDYFPKIHSSHAYHVYTNILISQFTSGFTIA